MLPIHVTSQNYDIVRLCNLQITRMNLKCYVLEKDIYKVYI